MTTLKNRLTDDMKQAMRAKDAGRLETIRGIRAAIQRSELDVRHELSESEVLDVIQKLVKQGKDAANQFIAGDRPDLAAKENAEVLVFSEYLPEQLATADILVKIDAAVAASNAASMSDMGKVMAILKKELANQADMGEISKMVKQRLN